MGVDVPTLDISGFVKGSAQKAERLFAYYLVSKHAQSRLHRNQVKSMQYSIATNSNIFVLKEVVKGDLESMFNAYFDTVLINVSVGPSASDPTNYDINIDMAVSDGANEPIALSALITASNGVISKVVTLNPYVRSVIENV